MTIFYPDVVVVCGRREFDREPVDVLLNPTVVIEVLSPSTENFDRLRKFSRYRERESLQEYVLFDQDERHAEHYARQTDGTWTLRDVIGAGTVMLTSIDCALPLDEVYALFPEV